MTKRRSFSDKFILRLLDDLQRKSSGSLHKLIGLASIKSPPANQNNYPDTNLRIQALLLYAVR